MKIQAGKSKFGLNHMTVTVDNHANPHGKQNRRYSISRFSHLAIKTLFHKGDAIAPSAGACSQLPQVDMGEGDVDVMDGRAGAPQLALMNSNTCIHN